MYYFCDRMSDAVIETGAKMNISQGFTDFDETKDPMENPRFAKTDALLKDYRGAADGRVIIDIALHAEYTSHPKFAAAVANYAKKNNIRMQVHVSETQAEHMGCKERHQGRTPVKYLSDMGIFDVPATAAHCVWVEPSDMEILAEKGVTVASCPVSNLKLASGVCDLPELMRHGVNVAIGTDSVASNNSLNFIEEMKFFALLSKERFEDPTLITPLQTLTAATRTGFLSQGRPDSGSIEEGMRADLILLDLKQPGMVPQHDLLTNVVYSASGSDIVTTMIDGKIVYDHGSYPTLDIEKVSAETERCVKEILAKL
jgi:5-methylthioadenosine/S-adenosylhomocysteine deaminase